MDFSWTDDQVELRLAAVEFATRRLADGVIERYRGSLFSLELWDECADFGLQGILVPAACSRVSTRVVLPQPLWPTREILRMASEV